MLEHLQSFQAALIHEFFQLYEQYEQDQIYACALVLNEYLGFEYLAISTRRSLFSEQEDPAQYLSDHDKWSAQKWRYRSQPHQQHLNQFKRLFTDYFQKRHIFGHPLAQQRDSEQQNHLQVLLNVFQQARHALSNAYGLDLSSMVFFMQVAKQPQMTADSARLLNTQSPLLAEFLAHQQRPALLDASSHPPAIKLQQIDKDLLIDLAQLLEIEPYDYLEIAHAAYLLTLEPGFIDSNLYIQRLIHSIAAMDSNEQGLFALPKDEVQQRIQQFYAM
ncbi:DUF4303 domain-containing protein [Acinetobacter sp. YH12157]|uniref:DUF4303 domain-containing protein n=1 Tax=Acinetobacter sp. YH12157 TaxID=2601137 RepID=UPI0015D1B6E0|nr:DUF4303 domain-containing protein [Acinetobacter sp. YH12157]